MPQDLTVIMHFTNAEGLHLHGTADCAFANDTSQKNGTVGPCCTKSSFIIRANDGSWTRTRLPKVVGSTVTIEATISAGAKNATDIAYAYENYPGCALYNQVVPSGKPAGPDTPTGLVAAPFRIALSPTQICPLQSVKCIGAADNPPGVVHTQCCGFENTKVHKLESCVPHAGCISHYYKPPPNNGHQQLY